MNKENAVDERIHFKGVFTFCPTPTQAGGEEIDESALRRFIEHQIGAQVHGLVVSGSTGGLGLYSDDERRRLAEIAVDQAAGRLPVIMGIGSISTSAAVRLARTCDEIGVDGLLVVPISYNKPNEAELVEHYHAIGRATSRPVIAYNNPFTTGVDITPALMMRIAEVDTIYHLKDSSGDLARPAITHRMSKGRVHVWSGHEIATPQAFAAGATGFAAALAAMAPKQCVAVYQAGVEASDIALSRDRFWPLLPLAESMHRHGYIRVVHTALQLLGQDVGEPRKPIRSLTDEARQEVADALRGLELL